MAYKMQLKMPYQGMPFVWNLSSKVSVVAGDAPNLAEDIELWQRLRVERLKRLPPKTKKSPVASIRRIQMPSGVLDVETAFDLLYCGLPSESLNDALSLSPARDGQSSYGKHIWTIVWANHRLYQADRYAWEYLPEVCSPGLKQSLLTKTRP